MPRYIISGGGTGGHIFPAIAIADALMAKDPTSEILFVGANGRMEMERVPIAGYKIIGLDIMGIQRKLTLKNLKIPFMLLKSLVKARNVIKEFKPDVAIGVGGYASGPMIRVASFLGVPTLIQEQNSFPGITNKLLAKNAASICVAYEGMDKFFPKEKICLTGNPIRKDMVSIEGKRSEALSHFGFKEGSPTLLVIGGSLGARSINHAIKQNIQGLVDMGLQVIWQTGKGYYTQMSVVVGERYANSIQALRFIDRMDLAYAAADLIISRAGAISISELCLIGKPTILVPSPNVSEDHQTKNAMALVKKDAAVLIADDLISDRLLPEINDLFKDKARQELLGKNIKALGMAEAPARIVEEIHRIQK